MKNNYKILFIILTLISIIILIDCQIYFSNIHNINNTEDIDILTIKIKNFTEIKDPILKFVDPINRRIIYLTLASIDWKELSIDIQEKYIKKYGIENSNILVFDPNSIELFNYNKQLPVNYLTVKDKETNINIFYTPIKYRNQK
jgi:hypothetical protein